LTASVGKEWSADLIGLLRTWGFLAIDKVNRVIPGRARLLVGQYNLCDIHRFTLFVENNNGYGPKTARRRQSFLKVWGKYQHQSIDIGASYGIRLGVWGILTATLCLPTFCA